MGFSKKPHYFMIPTCHTEDELAYITGILHNFDIEGNVCEVGVYNGATANLIRKLLPDRIFYLFDTFTGILGEHHEEKWKAGDYACSLDEVKRNIGDKFIFHKGDVIETKKEVFYKTFSFVHIDIDVYIPLHDILPFFYNRLNDGGIMLISNYDCEHDGVKKAVDEIFKVDKTYSRYVFIKK